MGGGEKSMTYTLKDYDQWADEEYCLEAVKNGLALQYVHKQTEKICLEAVKRDWMALRDVRKQTEKICLEAVKRNWMALRDVRKQTEKICLEAVKKDPDVIKYIHDRDMFMRIKMVIEL